MKKIISKFITDESGATSIEYGLITALIGVGIIVGASGVGQSTNVQFAELSDNFSQEKPLPARELDPGDLFDPEEPRWGPD